MANYKVIAICLISLLLLTLLHHSVAARNVVKLLSIDVPPMQAPLDDLVNKAGTGPFISDVCDEIPDEDCTRIGFTPIVREDPDIGKN
ncbi:hypothetical protein M9H77_09709 [Catharanthus roseus]|uniref:Uncharacterized protein n=1 Tax=Catharanthus roseus TaxID=4058 RepID=A0ACC0C1J6_CATRO|nr:hypothetical protein M9H77_09709 [Catharanthus roseus]